MTVIGQILGLPLFAPLLASLPESRACAVCHHVFTPERPNLVHQKYCRPACWLVAHNLHRRERTRQIRETPVRTAVPLPPVCQCGADLVRVESDWMTGTTIEVCAQGHRTNPVLRRRVA